VRRGEIYVIDLGPGVGHEAHGAQPVVVVTNDVSNETPVMVAVVPALSAPDPPPVGVAVPAARSGHPHDLIVLATQVRVVDARRFAAPASGTVPDDLYSRLRTR
jgi:mRNA interferase MazF